MSQTKAQLIEGLNINTSAPADALVIDSSGRLLVGISSSVDVASTAAAEFQVQTSGNITAAFHSIANAAGPAGILALGHGRGTASGVLQNDDVMGEIRFAGGDGTDLETQGAAIVAQVDGTPGSNDMPGRLVFKTTADGASSTTERLRIDSSGRVGIATTSPTFPLQVETSATGTTSGSNGVILVQSKASGRDAHIRFGDSVNATARVGYLSNSLYAWVNGAERLRIDTSGRVLVGTSSATLDSSQAVLQVSNSSGPLIVLGRNDTTVSSGNLIGDIKWYSNAGSANEEVARIRVDADAAQGSGDKPGRMEFHTTADGASSPTERMRINSSGNVGIGTTAPLRALTIAKTGSVISGTGNSFGFSINPQTNGYVDLDAVTGGSNNTSLSLRTYNNGTYTQAIQSISGNETTFETAGSERMRIDSSGRVGIGTTSPQRALVVSDAGAEGFEFYPGSSDTANTLNHYDRGSSSFIDIINNADKHIFGRADGEKMRLDSGGRLVIGSTSVRSFNTHASRFQVQGTDFSSQTASIVANSSDGNGAYLFFAKQRSGAAGGNTIVQSGDLVGQLRFNACDGVDMETVMASIDVRVDGTPGSNDMPGRIEFRTTADGASGTTERMRLASNGNLAIGNTNPAARLHVTDTSGNAQLRLTGSGGNSDIYSTADLFLQPSGSTAMTLKGSTGRVGIGMTAPAGQLHVEQTTSTLPGQYVDGRNGSYGASLTHFRVSRGNNSGYNFLVCQAAYTGSVDNEFILRGDGNAYADDSWNGGGADYAEYFEWSDGNTEAEDRRGISVVLDGDKIREAVTGEEPIGVISGNPSVVGDADIARWKHKYLRDDFGTYIRDEEGERQLNPDYDPDTEYVSREDRPEWDTVGLMGKLRIRKGQVIGTRWIKMRDVSDTVEEWLVR